MEILKKSPKALNKAIAVLKSGGVVICPTDTVYGFLVDASNKKAVDRIYKIKKRPRSKPLPVFVKDLTMAKGLAEIEERQETFLKKNWPGKVTAVLKRKKGKEIFGVKKDSIAIRIPKHVFLQSLLKKINRPLAQTSVNISNEETIKNIEQIVATFERSKLIALIVDGGPTQRGKSSKVVDLMSKILTILRK